MTWDEVAARQGGVVSRRQLLAAGQSKSAVTRLTDRGQLGPMLQGVFLVRGAPTTRLALIWAAVLGTEGVVGFESAAHLWRQLDDPPDRVHICVDHVVRSHTPSWMVLHRVVLPSWARTYRGSLPVTSRSWTVLDLVAVARRETEATRLLDRGLQQKWVSPHDIDERLAGAKGRIGNRRLRRLREQLGDGAQAASERRLHTILREGGLAGWMPNFAVSLFEDRVAVVDVAFPDWKLAIEVDGWAYHHDVDRFRRDRQRQNSLVSLGWTVLRFTWADLTQRPGYVLATVRELGALRSTG
jgi:very-short-patch-repair endonuclease